MEEKTEEATPKKLRDERDKGNVATSKEVVSAFVLSAIISVAFVTSTKFFSETIVLMNYSFSLIALDFDFALKAMIERSFQSVVVILIPFTITTIFASILSNMIQTGPLLSFEPVKPKPEKISVISGFKKIVSVKNLVEFLKSVTKILVLSILISVVIVRHFDDLMNLVGCGVHCVMPLIRALFFRIFLIIAVCFFIIAILDYIFVVRDHAKKLKMSPDEVKREHKDVEGDPQIKGERKKFHQELLNGSTSSRVKLSSVVVTNPTRLAIGILYDKKVAALPIVTIKGAHLDAAMIRRAAERYEIPIIENKPLARSLIKKSNEGDFVCSELLEAVAIVLRHVSDVSKAKEIHLDRF